MSVDSTYYLLRYFSHIGIRDSYFLFFLPFLPLVSSLYSLGLGIDVALLVTLLCGGSLQLNAVLVCRADLQCCKVVQIWANLFGLHIHFTQWECCNSSSLFTGFEAARSLPTYFEILMSCIIGSKFRAEKSWCTVGFEPRSLEARKLQSEYTSTELAGPGWDFCYPHPNFSSEFCVLFFSIRPAKTIISAEIIKVYFLSLFVFSLLAEFSKCLD